MRSATRRVQMLLVVLGLLSGSALALAADAPAAPEASHDFDFEFGKWNTHVHRLLHPLSGSQAWADYDGTTTVTPVWNGRANLVQLEADGSAGHLEFLSLRLFNPDSHHWSLNVASSRGGELGVPTVGGFQNGRGEFYDHESWNGKPIVVRFVIIPQGKDNIRFEQAFSPDDGKTWEMNWIATDTRVPD